MGLIRMAKDAIGNLVNMTKDAAGSVLDDQFLEYFYCTSLSPDVLMAKGEKQFTGGRKNYNTNGNDNIISNGSIISINEGQCMIIVDQGKIADFCAEAGEFRYDASSEPSLLYGKLGENIKSTFAQFGKRWVFGGNTAKDQRVYYFNTKEIMNNLYGTATPIPFRVFDSNTGFDFDTTVKCNGRYSFKIADPLLFYVNVCGNVAQEYRKSDLITMMKDELLTAMQPALANIAMKGVRPYELSAHAELVRDALKEELSEQWTAIRGIEMVSMTINSDIPKEDRERITKWQDTAMLRNGAMASARQTEAFSAAIENMGKGGSGEGGDASAMNGAMSMMAMGMMQNMMGNGFGMNNQMNQQAQQPAQPMKPASTVAEGAVLGWTCSCGKTDNRSKFCEECGLPKPALDGWTCSCGKVNQGKFCPECGKKRPEGAPLYRCDKCGWEPEDPKNPPKFCPECGDMFDDNDIQS